jgi:hypothetical protein
LVFEQSGWFFFFQKTVYFSFWIDTFTTIIRQKEAEYGCRKKRPGAIHAI